MFSNGMQVQIQPLITSRRTLAGHRNGPNQGAILHTQKLLDVGYARDRVMWRHIEKLGYDEELKQSFKEEEERIIREALEEE